MERAEADELFAPGAGELSRRAAGWIEVILAAASRADVLSVENLREIGLQLYWAGKYRLLTPEGHQRVAPALPRLATVGVPPDLVRSHSRVQLLAMGATELMTWLRDDAKTMDALVKHVLAIKGIGKVVALRSVARYFTCGWTREKAARVASLYQQAEHTNVRMEVVGIMLAGGLESVPLLKKLLSVPAEAVCKAFLRVVIGELEEGVVDYCEDRELVQKSLEGVK